MSVSTIIYSIKQGIKNIRRNRMFSLAAIGTIMACLFLFGIFYFILMNFQHMIKNVETSVGVTVFFDEHISEDRIEEIGSQIKVRPEVKDMKFVSSSQAWEDFKKNYFNDSDELSEAFGNDNPLENSASYSIYTKDISMQETLVNYIKKIDGVRDVRNSQTVAENLKDFNRFLGYISIAIVSILVGVSVFLISTTVAMGISVRKGEISIMKLIGATDFFIRAPFIVEGLIIGIIGSAIPLIGLKFLYSRVISYILAKMGSISGILVFMDPSEIFSKLVPVSLLIGVGIGFIGSFVTVRKHLKV